MKEEKKRLVVLEIHCLIVFSTIKKGTIGFERNTIYDSILTHINRVPPSYNTMDDRKSVFAKTLLNRLFKCLYHLKKNYFWEDSDLDCSSYNVAHFSVLNRQFFSHITEWVSIVNYKNFLMLNFVDQDW